MNLTMGLREKERALREKAVRAAMVAAEGRVDEAAAALELSTRQLFRILSDPAFKDVPRAPTGVHRGGHGG